MYKKKFVMFILNKKYQNINLKFNNSSKIIN